MLLISFGFKYFVLFPAPQFYNASEDQTLTNPPYFEEII